MAAARDPNDVLHSTRGKDNFQRVARLLISGGTTLLREVFDQIYPPASLPGILNNLAIRKTLKQELYRPQYDCVYPSSGVYGKSADFDVTLLFKLLRKICHLTPPVTGWDDLPVSTDHSLEADLARIKYYRNSAYGHVKQSMEMTDDVFLPLWQEISEALVRIARQISHAKESEWQRAIDSFRKDPLTADDERHVEELKCWYRNDTEIKEYMEKFHSLVLTGMEHLETSAQEVIEEKSQHLETTVKEEAQSIKDQLAGEFQCLRQEFRQPQSLKEYIDRHGSSTGGLQTAEDKFQAATEELKASLKDIANNVDEIKDKLGSSAESPQTGEAHLPLRIDCKATGSSSLSKQEVLDLAMLQLQLNDPSKQSDYNGFVYHLEMVRKVSIVDAKQGSLIITVKCRSLEILNGLWEDYRNGYLNKMAQKFLVTKELLDELGLTEAKLTVEISTDEYTRCLRKLSSYLGQCSVL